MAGAETGQKGDEDKRYAYRVVLAGLAVLAFVFGLSAWKWTSASEVTSVLTSVGSIVGSVVGAFFGVQLGAAGKKEADREAARARREATTLAMFLPPTQLNEAKAALEELR